MTGTVWIDGAERFGDGSIGGPMDTPDLPPRSTEHTVECPPGRGWFLSMGAYLVRASTEPQTLYDPLSDSLGQFGPLNESGRALRNAGSVRTNRTGRVNIQTEVCGRAAKPWTDGFRPADKPNFLKLVAAKDSWGIPRAWPAGPPQAYPGDHDDRDMSTWLNSGGYFGHSQVPGQDHGDPGAIDITKCPPTNIITPPVKPPADPDRFPGAQYFGPGRSNGYVTRLGQMLVSRGAGRFYRVGPSPQWGEADRLAVQAFQRAQGWSGEDADGFPGPTTWRMLVSGTGNNIPAPAPTPAPIPAPVRQSVSLRQVRAAAAADPPAPDGHTTHRAPVLIVEHALAAEGLLEVRYADGSFGTKTKTAYAAFQREIGFTGSDADGIPGMQSLSELGKRYGFTVTA